MTRLTLPALSVEVPIARGTIAFAKCHSLNRPIVGPEALRFVPAWPGKTATFAPKTETAPYKPRRVQIPEILVSARYKVEIAQ